MLGKIKALFADLAKPMPLDNNFKDYNEYWNNRGFHAPSLNRAKIITRFVESDCSILDIGCGDGTIMEYLNNNNRPKEVVGLDISEQAVEYVKNNGYIAYTIDAVSDDFARFLENKYFDYIIITEVLEHVQDPEKIIEMIKDHFSKAIIISVPNAGFITHRLRLLLGRFPVVTIVQHVKEHIRFWTIHDFHDWCGYFGFHVDKCISSLLSKYKIINVIKNSFPSLFAEQVIYVISKNKNNN